MQAEVEGRARPGAVGVVTDKAAGRPGVRIEAFLVLEQPAGQKVGQEGLRKEVDMGLGESHVWG